MPTSPRDARMVGIIAPMGGEIEGDRQALLAGGEVAPIEGVRILSRGEAGILPDRPGLRHVHRRVGAAQIRRDTGIRVQKLDPLAILRPVDALHRDAFRRHPGLACRRHGRREGICRVGDVREIRDTGRHVIELVRRRMAKHYSEAPASGYPSQIHFEDEPRSRLRGGGFRHSLRLRHRSVLGAS